jgi:hypothetical protein
MSTVQPSDVIPVVVDLPSLSVNFPPTFQAEVPRANIVSTLTNLVVESVYAAIIEGPEGIGETTVLSQFARRHSSNAISIFITSANRLSFRSRTHQNRYKRPSALDSDWRGTRSQAI